MDASVLEQGFLGRLEPRQAERLQKISGKARHLLTLIQDYLDLARVEGSGLNYRPRPGVDFTGDVVQPVLDGLQTQLEEQRTRFAQDFPESPSPVDCDPGLLNIVMANLLGNAVKYGNEEGLIRLRVSQPEGQLAVSVWNAGPGFPKSERSKLFKKFSRLQSRELMARKGSGVGLYTCWRIIQAHGGRIRADSEPGAWAEFSFEIPQPLPSTVRG
jgi:signal transduction histidine kinase